MFSYRQKPQQYTSRVHKFTAYEDMLPKTATNETLRRLFEPYGKIKEIHIIRDQEGRHKVMGWSWFEQRLFCLCAIYGRVFARTGR